MSKEIKYDRITKDYVGYLNGVAVAWEKTAYLCEVELDRIAYEMLAHGSGIAVDTTAA